MFYDAVKDDDNPTKNTAAGIGFATSVDGMNWTKNTGPVFTTNNGPNEAKGIIIGSAVLFKDSRYWLFYPGAADWEHYSISLATFTP